MKTLKIIMSKSWIAVLIAIVTVSMCSCGDNLEVTKSSPFSVSLMPYRHTIDANRPVELRFNLTPEKTSREVYYTVRQFQYTGYGTLTLDGTVLNPNDRYRVSPGDFRMYFNAPPLSGTSYNIEIVFEDNFGRSQTVVLNFQLNGTGNDDEEQETGGGSSAAAAGSGIMVIPPLKKDGTVTEVTDIFNPGSPDYIGNADSPFNPDNPSSLFHDGNGYDYHLEGDIRNDAGKNIIPSDFLKEKDVDWKQKPYTPDVSKVNPDSIKDRWMPYGVRCAVSPGYLSKNGQQCILKVFLAVKRTVSIYQNGKKVETSVEKKVVDISGDDEAISYVCPKHIEGKWLEGKGGSSYSVYVPKNELDRHRLFIVWQTVRLPQKLKNGMQLEFKFFPQEWSYPYFIRQL